MKKQTQISTSAVLFLTGIFIWSIPFWIGICDNMPNYKAWLGLMVLCVTIWSAALLYLEFAKNRIKK